MRAVIGAIFWWCGAVILGVVAWAVLITSLSCLLGNTVTITRPDGVVVIKCRDCPELKVTVQPEDCP